MAEIDKASQAYREHAAVLDSFAVNENDEQVTVVGTMGQDPNEKPKITKLAWVILALCTLAQFQNTFLGIAPAANAYSIAGALNGMDKRIWIVQAQAVPSIVSGPIMAIISDVYGRRYLLIGVWTMFCVASILSMTAHGMTQMIIGQTLAGVASGVSGIIFGIASEVLPSRWRAYAQTVVNVFSSLAAVVALVCMGLASQNDHDNGWRWVFRTRLIMEGILLLGFAFCYFPPPRTIQKNTFMEKVKSLDWIGYFLLMAGLVPLLMGFAWSGTYGWSDKHSYVSVIIGAIFFILTCLYEWKGTSRGFMDHRLFKEGRNWPLLLFIISVEGALFYLYNNVFTAQMNGIWAPPGSVEAGAKTLPFFMAVMVLAPFMSIYVTKRKDLKWPLAAGFTFFTAGMIGIALAGTSAVKACVFAGLGGIGFTAPLILVTTLAQLSTPPLFIGIASALVISSRTLGGTVGLGIAEAIYGSFTTDQIPAAIAETALSMGLDPSLLGALIGGLFSGQGLSVIPGPIIGAASAEMVKIQVHAYKIVWLAFLPGTIIAAIACCFLVNPTERMNWVTDAPLKMPAQHAEAAKEHSVTSDINAVDEMEK